MITIKMNLIIKMMLPYLLVLLLGIIGKIKVKKQMIIFLFYVYIVGVISIVFLPLPIDYRLIRILRETGFVLPNLIPLKTIILLISRETIIEAFKQIAGNIILFIPLGFFIPLIFNKLNTFKKIAIVGVIGSFIIEIIQLLVSLNLQFTYKFTDIDDILLNTLGSIIGLYILGLAAPILKHIVNVPCINFNIRSKAD